LLLDVAMVQNTGTYNKTFWWDCEVTAQQLQDQATAKNGRIVNLEPYVVGGTTNFCYIMIHNVGADYSDWTWVYGKSPGAIALIVTTGNGWRFVDLRQYSNGSSSLYSAVMVLNAGANYSEWWYYIGITPAQIGQYAAQKNAYVASLDPANSGGTAF